MPVMEKLLTVEEVADSLHVSRDVVWRLIRLEKLVAYRIEGSLRVHPDDLRAYLDKQKINQKKQTE